MSKIKTPSKTNNRSIVIIVLLALVAALQVSCTTVSMQDGVSSTSKNPGNYLPGKFVWHDLLTSDIDGAKSFYGALFGWTFEQGDQYVVIRHGNQEIGGIALVENKPAEQHVARWIGSLSVSNLDKAIELVLKKGGKVHEGPNSWGNRGRRAFISDPNGAQLAIVRLKHGDPVDQPIEIGAWLWNELWSTEANQSLTFYTNLAEYSSVDELDNYWLLKSGDRWRAGVRSLFDKKLEQRWVPVVRVGSAKKISTLAESLGGTIIIAAEEAPDTEQVALLKDTSGALFMVQEWHGKDEVSGAAQ